MLRFPLVNICSMNFFDGRKANEEFIKEFIRKNYNKTVEHVSELLNISTSLDDFNQKVSEILNYATNLALENETFSKNRGLSAEELFFR